MGTELDSRALGRTNEPGKVGGVSDMSTGHGAGTHDDTSSDTQATARAERAARRLQTPMIVAALLAIPTIVVQESNLGKGWEAVASVLDWSIWAVFAANLLIMLILVPDRKHWLIRNPMDVLIVVLTPPFLPATLKLARLLPIVRLVWLMVVAHRMRNVFSLQGLRYAALIVFTIVVGGGAVFVAVEHNQDLSIWDGLWWAAETVTTVAYGDIYPTTALGRIVATVVMTAGIGFVALLTGALAQRFLYGETDATASESHTEQEDVAKKLEELSLQIAKLQKALEDRGR
jgi:voltage-gated potassium channel